MTWATPTDIHQRYQTSYIATLYGVVSHVAKWVFGFLLTTHAKAYVKQMRS